jgi:hypothetical protein
MYTFIGKGAVNVYVNVDKWTSVSLFENAFPIPFNLRIVTLTGVGKPVEGA